MVAECTREWQLYDDILLHIDVMGAFKSNDFLSEERPLPFIDRG